VVVQTLEVVDAIRDGMGSDISEPIDAKVIRAMAMADVNQDGRIDYDEFKGLMLAPGP
jgi:Ca2+-binding EF-hand superfamily protein